MVRVEVPAIDVEVVADLLWLAGASAVEEAASADGREAIVLTADLDICPESIGGRWPCRVEQDDERWWDGWRPFARAARAGGFLVRAPWVDGDAAPGEPELIVDPGRSFGTGSHPSTLLALDALASRWQTGARVLDVGCGSGVLAIGAALLGAAEVVAVDIDPAAVEATAANARRNGVASAVTVSGAPLAELPPGGFDLVLANLGSPLVIDLSAPIAARVAAGGALVLSGFLADRWEHVLPAYPDFAVGDAPALDGWRAVILERVD